MRLHKPRPATWAGLALPLLVVVSWYVVFVYADEEPFVGPLWPDAIICLGLPLVVIAVWLWFQGLVFRVTSKATFSLLRISSMVCSLVCISFMVFCMCAYLSDVCPAGNRQAAVEHAGRAAR